MAGAPRWGVGLGWRALGLGLLALISVSNLRAAELVRLSQENWADWAPQGKEVDCILGDLVLRNERVQLVIADPVEGRNANMTVRGVGGCVIDFTRRDQANDQLSAFYPGGGTPLFTSRDGLEVLVDGQPREIGEGTLSGARIEVRLAASEGGRQLLVRYVLTDDDDGLQVETEWTNQGKEPQPLEWTDSIRADRTFAFGADPETQLFWASDDWFRQAYGVVAPGWQVSHSGTRGVVVKYSGGPGPEKLGPGESATLRRTLTVAGSLAALRGDALRRAGLPLAEWSLTIRDAAGPVANAQVAIRDGDREYATARTIADGKLSLVLPRRPLTLAVSAPGRPAVERELAVGNGGAVEVELARCGYALVEVTDEDGMPLPCKVQFIGLDGTPDPDFGPDSAAGGVKNLLYTHNGRGRRELLPGAYELLISHGPEYNIATSRIEVRAGETAEVETSLPRPVRTDGWISSDFHNHSSPSGDNTSSTLGRVLNLLCENIEFAPCTEHNRIASYSPILRRLGIESQLATCTGMELTGSPLPVNHQNAFPLRHRPRQQDGGGPRTDPDPVVQIERLAMWDEGAEKLVQGNHPDLVQILTDKDLDGKFDGGFAKMLGFMDVMEVHPPQNIFTPPTPVPAGRNDRNAIYRWMQLINLGHRLTGVVNTDAHYNFHGSGWLRNYVASSTDDPAEIDTMEMVHAAEAGHVVMTTGPFLEVTAAAGDARAIPGDDLAAQELELRIRVQCPNWFDINRVQVFLNGRPSPELNFTRREHPDRFSDRTVRFDQRLPVRLTADTHIIVATIGEGLTLGRVMGPESGELPPVAVANPIFVDVDGGGFKPNGDQLDVPFPAPAGAENAENKEAK